MGAPKHVLYVDDDADMAFLSEAHLLDEGYRVTCVDSVQAALELVQTQPTRIDVVVTDYQMPGMSGAQLAALVAKTVPGLPVILTSAYVDDARKQVAREAGAVALVPKAPDSAPLLGCLATLGGDGSPGFPPPRE